MGSTAIDLIPAGAKVEKPATPRLGDDYAAIFCSSNSYKRIFQLGTVCASLSFFVVLTNFFGHPQINFGPFSRIEGTQFDRTPLQPVGSARELVQQLKDMDLWDMPPDGRVPPVFFTGYPQDFDLLETETKKRVFLHTLLPVVLAATDEVKRERRALEGILANFEDSVDLVFDYRERGWQDRLNEDQIELISNLTVKYRSQRATDLLARVDTFPVSLVMAQAALESSWGASRFAEQGNNIFGMWTWGEHGIVPADREEGKNHKIAVYDSILGSVRAYLLTLNRLPAYRKLRQLRQETGDSLLLAEGLRQYSERGQVYVAELQAIIRANELNRYDNFTLASRSSSPVEPIVATTLM